MLCKTIVSGGAQKNCRNTWHHTSPCMFPSLTLSSHRSPAHRREASCSTVPLCAISSATPSSHSGAQTRGGVLFSTATQLSCVATAALVRCAWSLNAKIKPFDAQEKKNHQAALASRYRQPSSKILTIFVRAKRMGNSVATVTAQKSPIEIVQRRYVQRSYY